MQAKIHFLTRSAHRKNGSRRAFALIAAVFVMLLISIMLLKMLAYTADSNQRTVYQYLDEQARLLAYSATEYAVLAVSGTNRQASGCITTITSAYPSAGANKMFDITTTIRYVWSDDASLGADRLSNLPASCTGANLLAQVATPQEHGGMLVDVVVSSASNLNLDEPIRFHRRTLQKL